MYAQIRTTTVAVALGLLCAAAPAQQPTTQPLTPTRKLPLPDENAPRLKLSSKVWDFGTVWYGDECKTELTLSNAGKSPLKIGKIDSSCGCTVAKPAVRELAPGQSTKLTITYNTRKNTKRVYQRIRIHTNDPRQPEATVIVKGEVLNVFDCKPNPRLTMGFILPDTAASETIELTSNVDQPVHPRLRPVPAEAPFDIRLETIDEGRKYRLSAATRPPLKVGVASYNVIIETGYKKIPIMRIPVTAIVSERVSVTPPKVLITRVQTKPGLRMLRVNYLEDHPLKILEVRSSLPQIKVQVISRPPAGNIKTVFKSHMIKLSIPPYDQLPAEGATIEITTDDPDPRFKKLTVPVEKVVPKRRH